jgi:tetratricopeptide (TPR) repeat protein
LLSVQPPALVVPELRETLLTQLATHLLGAGQAREAVEVLQSKLARSGELTATMHFTLGLAFMQLRQIAEAMQQLRRCLAVRDRPALSPVRKEVRQGGPHHCLALCYKALQQPREADAAFRAALREAPESRPVRQDYAQFLAESGRPVEALQLWHQLTTERPDDLAAWVAGGQIALSRPDFIEFACDWTGEALKQFPAEPHLLQQRVEALLLHQDVPAAGLVLRQNSPLPTAQLGAARALCELLAGQELTCGPWPEPAMSHEFLKWYRALIAWNATPLIGAINARLHRLAAKLPSAAHLLEQALQTANHETAV